MHGRLCGARVEIRLVLAAAGKEIREGHCPFWIGEWTAAQ